MKDLKSYNHRAERNRLPASRGWDDPLPPYDAENWSRSRTVPEKAFAYAGFKRVPPCGLLRTA